MDKSNFRVLWILLVVGFPQARIGVYAQSTESIEYKVCATKKTSSFEKELNEFALKGFHLASNAALSTTTAILSKAKSDNGKKYEYKLIDPVTLKKQKSELLSQGYKFRVTLFDTSGSPLSMLKFWLHR